MYSEKKCCCFPCIDDDDDSDKKMRRVHSNGDDDASATITRPKPGNPNLIETFQQVSPSFTYADNDNFYAHQDNANVASFMSDKGKEEDDDYYDNDMYNDDVSNLNDKFVDPRIRSQSNGQKRPHQDSPAIGLPTFGDGDPLSSVQPTVVVDSGIDFLAVKQRVERKARLLADPIIKFVADVAVKTGTGLEQMLVSPDAPLVNTRATSVGDFLGSGGSKVSAEFLTLLLAAVLVQMLSSGKERRALVTATEEGVAAKKFKPPPPPPSPSPFMTEEEEELSPVVTIKKEKQEPAECLIAAHAYLQTRYNVIASTISGDEGTLPFIGADGLGGQQQQQQQVDPLLKDLMNAMAQMRSEMHKDTSWDKMPETLGLSIVRPEVLAVIETAHEDIKRTHGGGGGSSGIQLWHLMTSPGVRHHFAMMVAGMLNAIPSEIQYPHYSRSFRDNGAVTGSRVSSGLWTQVRNAALYKEKMKWFQHVRYTQSSAWKEVQERLPNAQFRIGLARTEVVKFTERVTRLARATWNRFGGNDDDEYRIAMANLYDRQRVLRVLEEETLPALLREREQRARDGLPVQNADARIQEARSSILQTRAQIVSITRKVREELMGNDKWKRAFFLAGAALVPFVGFEASIGTQSIYNHPAAAPSLPFMRFVTPNILQPDEDDGQFSFATASEIGMASQRLLAGVSSALERALQWVHATDLQQPLYELTDAVSGLAGAYRQFELETRNFARDTARLRSFSERDKIELVYSRTEADSVRPVRDYLQRESIYASAY